FGPYIPRSQFEQQQQQQQQLQQQQQPQPQLPQQQLNQQQPQMALWPGWGPCAVRAASLLQRLGVSRCELCDAPVDHLPSAAHQRRVEEVLRAQGPNAELLIQSWGGGDFQFHHFDLTLSVDC
ncbi:unnamed protein product, partial [Polarella glacialis]